MNPETLGHNPDGDSGLELFYGRQPEFDRIMTIGLLFHCYTFL